MQFEAMQCHSMPFDASRCKSMLFDVIRCNLMQFNAIHEIWYNLMSVWIQLFPNQLLLFVILYHPPSSLATHNLSYEATYLLWHCYSVLGHVYLCDLNPPFLFEVHMIVIIFIHKFKFMKTKIPNNYFHRCGCFSYTGEKQGLNAKCINVSTKKY